MAVCTLCGRREGDPALFGRCRECDAERGGKIVPESAVARRRFSVKLDALRAGFLRFFDFRSRIVALVLGCGWIGWGFLEYRVGGDAARVAESVELEQLISGYVPENQHIRIGRHRSIYTAMIYSRRFTSARDPEVEYAFYPLLPADSPEPEVEELKILVKSKRYMSVSKLPAKDEISLGIEGLLINRITWLSSKEADLIREWHPEIDPEDLLILEEGRQPWRSSSAFLMMAVGGLMLSAGAAAEILSRRTKTSANDGGSGEAHTGNPRNTNELQRPWYEDPGDGSIGDFIRHKLETVALLFSCIGFSIAGVTAVFAVAALITAHLCLIVGALTIATPPNLFFYFAVRRVKGYSEGGYGLGPFGWRLVCWSSYGLGAGAALWVVLGLHHGP